MLIGCDRSGFAWVTALALLGWMAGAACLLSESAVAQITPDETLGDDRSIVNPGVQVRGDVGDRIDGGATRGANLFHSFQEFNVEEGQRVYFGNPDDIANIFSRVTGGNPSNILGTLGVDGAANLFFLNPNGILFGPSASLDVSGSFVATTANGIQFGEQGFFSATNPESPSQLLTVNPSAFFFNQVANQPTNSIESRATLTVPEGQSLLLVGGRVAPDTAATGNILIREGRLRAGGGRIELGGLGAPGAIGLNIRDDQLSLTFPDNVPRIDVSLTGEFDGFAELDVTSGGGGDIVIHARNINILGGSDLCAGIGASGNCDGQATDLGAEGRQAGDITLNAQGAVTIAGSGSLVENDVNSDALGNSGDINIQANSVLLSDGGGLSARVAGQGNSGSINVIVSENIRVESNEENYSFIASSVNRGASGSSGGINISTGSLNVFGGDIRANAFGQGDAGAINITARERIILDGSGINSYILSNVGSDAVAANTTGISITTGSLIISDGSQIRANVSGEGSTGSVRIFARDEIVIDGRDEESYLNLVFYPSGIFTRINEGGEGNTSGMVITTGSLRITNRAQLLSETQGIGDPGDIVIDAQDQVFLDNSIIISEVTEGLGVGDGGNIIISTGTLELRNGSSLLADTENIGNAGNITITARGAVILTGEGPGANNPDQIIPSQITSTVDQTEISGGVGEGGDITITAGSLSLTDDGFISSATENQGNAGNIFIKVTAGSLVVADDGLISSSTIGQGNAGSVIINVRDNIFLNGGDIRSSVETDAIGNGGNVNITTGSLFANSVGQVSASTDGQGHAGNIRISARDRVAFDGKEGQYPSGAFSNVINNAIGNGGNIEITARSFSLSNGAELVANTRGEGNAGNITIDANNIQLASDSGVFTNVRSTGVGNAGVTQITADTLSLSDESRILSNTFGQGNAGDIFINADNIQLTNGSVITSAIRAGGVGNGGDIEIQSSTISLTDGSQISAFVGRQERDNQGNIIPGGQGMGGDLHINASDSITLSGVNNNGFSSGFFTLTERGASGRAGNVHIRAGDLAIADGAIVVASTYNSDRGGDIFINANNVEATGGGQIVTSTRSSGNAGLIQLNADRIVLSGFDPNFADRLQRVEDYIPTTEGQFEQVSDIINNEGANSGIFANTTLDSSGEGGTITIEADLLSLRNQAEISAATSGTGSAGNIRIRDADRVSLDNAEITTAINPEARLDESDTDRGDITIETNQLRLANGANITASTSGQGNAGDVTIRGAETITLDRSSISTAVNRNAIGQGGDIEIRTGLLQLDNQSQISSSTLGRGNTGDILVRATDGITLDDRAQITSSVGRNAIGDSQSITLHTSDLSLNNRSQISAATAGQGNAGDILVQDTQRIDLASGSSISTAVNENAVGQGGTIDIATEVLNLDDRSEISARSQGREVAGDITITASEQFTATDSDIITASSRSSGGDIRITSSDIRLLGDSDIRTNSGVDGGNITLSANTILAFEDSDILAFAERQGGDITLDTEAFFGDGYQETSNSDTNPAGLDGNERVDINASGQVSSGTITTPDTSFIQNSLTELPDNAIDTDNLVANSCVVRSQTQAGTFVIAGAEGLPQRPGDAPFPTYPTGAVRSTEESSGEPTWQMGDPIVEPQGLYLLEDGRMVLSRECLEEG